MDSLALFDTIINGLFFNKHWESGEVPFTFFVHASIINKWKKIMDKMFINSDWEMYTHILQLRSKLFEMRLIIVLRATRDQIDFLRDSINKSQLSFPWEENPTLFIDAENFNLMEIFIEEFDLQADILKVEEQLGHFVYDDYPIKVVSFKQSVSAKLDIIDKLKDYCVRPDRSLFMVFGFPWQLSHFLQKTHLNDYLYLTLPIILRHLATLNYTNDLDIMDLLSLRLAISDVRDPSKSNPIIDEIDFMINRGLATLIENNHLSIYEYLVARNSKPSQFLIFYMAYEFQHLFSTSDLDGLNKLTILNDTIKLKEEIDVLNKLNERFNVRYRIKGKVFNKMSFSIFEGLIESDEVYEIDLERNYRWLNNASHFELNKIISAYKKVAVLINFNGENTYNIIEGFASGLKTITFNHMRFFLHIVKCNLNDYRIFDNSSISEVNISGIKIDLNMLATLEQCDVKPRMLLFGCSLENTCRNWQLLNNLGNLRKVMISEDEGTWSSMFEFIEKEIRKSNTSEFKFNSKLTFRILNYYDVRMDLNKMKFTLDEQKSKLRNFDNGIDLNKIKFIIDEQNSKLEIRDAATNEIVDLYCKMRKIQQEEKPDYEFYE